MRAKVILLALGLGVCCQGCTLVKNATDNICFEVSLCRDNVKEEKRNRNWAKMAWQEALADNPSCPDSVDYACGFADGFVDYVEAGGTGEPPLLPPRKYWKSNYQSPQGTQAIQDWFAGFRHGAHAARKGGYRSFVTLPTSLSTATPLPPLVPTILAGPQQPPVPMQELHMPGKVAPKPTPVPPGPPPVPPQPAQTSYLSPIAVGETAAPPKKGGQTTLLPSDGPGSLLAPSQSTYCAHKAPSADQVSRSKSSKSEPAADLSGPLAPSRVMPASAPSSASPVSSDAATKLDGGFLRDLPQHLPPPAPASSSIWKFKNAAAPSIIAAPAVPARAKAQATVRAVTKKEPAPAPVVDSKVPSVINVSVASTPLPPHPEPGERGMGFASRGQSRPQP